MNDDNIILSIGYNGFPRGCSDSALPWSKRSQSGSILDTKYPYVSGNSTQQQQPTNRLTCYRGGRAPPEEMTGCGSCGSMPCVHTRGLMCGLSACDHGALLCVAGGACGGERPAQQEPGTCDRRGEVQDECMHVNDCQALPAAVRQASGGTQPTVVHARAPPQKRGVPTNPTFP